MDKDATQEGGYIAYKADDLEFFGARDVVEEEYAFIRQRRGEVTAKASEAPEKVNKRPDDLTGLALSGGGIRSASFCVGVLQALAYAGWLKNVDYLSTVSGGGYIGSSLTWLLHRNWPDPESHGSHITFGVDNDNFPYGTYPVAASATQKGSFKPSYKGRMLRYLRQNGRYLTPGHGISSLSLAAVVLRSSLFSVTVYALLLLILFLGFGGWLLLRPIPVPQVSWMPSVLPETLNLALWSAMVLGTVFVVFTFLYSMGTFLSRYARILDVHYRVRRWYEILAGGLLGVVIALVIVGVLPHVHDWLVDAVAKQQASLQDFVIKGTQGEAGKLEIQGTITQAAAQADGASGSRGFFALIAGSLSTLFGLAASVMAFLQTQSTRKTPIRSGLLVTVGTGGLLFGMLLLTYHAFVRLWAAYDGNTIAWIFAGSLAAFCLIARAVNINYMSVHRYYRDRLMETFLPDVSTALDVDGTSGLASKADRAPLHEMWPTLDKVAPGPYHIINTNVVLVSSDIPKFRGRGGDNFILTPHYCGSNATGWGETKRFYPWMTLSSAMAISGAAVNPNTGGGGKGITRQPFLAFLMGFLNIRLGYWLLNPMPSATRLKKQCKYSIAARPFHWLGEWLCPDLPNAICPGLLELFLRKNLDETCRMLQLTDGGHFENLGLYELIRRKLPLIIACDGAADPRFGFDDLANAIEKVRADFGVIIDIDCPQLERLTPQRTHYGVENEGAMRYAEQGYLLARIKYPNSDPSNRYTEGTLIYLTTTFSKGLTPDLFGYRKVNPKFPDEPTSDQFFDERQFEAYRELGYQTTWQMFSDPAVGNDIQVLKTMGPPPKSSTDSGDKTQYVRNMNHARMHGHAPG